MLDPAFQTTLATVAERAPRIVVLAAPAGYRKTLAARMLADTIGTFVPCTLNAADLAWTITEALAARDGARFTRSAADRLAQRRTDIGSPSRDALRREWPLVGGPELVMLRDPASALTTPRGAELIGELLGAIPPERTVALAVRASVPRALLQSIQRERSVILTQSDLAHDESRSAALAGEYGVATAHARTLHRMTAGWPLVEHLLARLSGSSGADEVIEAARAVPHDALLAFAMHRTIAELPRAVRDALVVAVLLRDATYARLVRVLGDCDDSVFTRLCRLPFCESADDRVSVHPEVELLLRARFASVVGELYEHTLRVLTGEGAYAEAARVALEAGDAARAASIVDAAPPYTAAPVPIAAYGKIIDRLDRGMITRFPNVWVATIPYRSFTVDVAQYVREAETIYYCIPAAASEDQRTAVLMLLASAYVNIGRASDADALLDEALRGFASGPTPARAAILNFTASLRGIDGRFAEARTLADEAAHIRSDAFGENQTLHYIASHEAAYRGKQDRVVVIVDELVRRRRAEDLPLYVAYAAASGAIFSWASGDDVNFQRYLRAIEDALTPGLESAFAPIVDAARGRPLTFPPGEPWPAFVAMAQLYAIAGAADDAQALAAARASAAAADVRGDPYLQLLAHAALFILDAGAREREGSALRAIVAPIESEELHAAVESLVLGRPPGILEPFVKRIGRDTKPPSRIRIELIGGRVVRDAVDVRLTDKELEMLALLASTRGALSRDRIGEALWDHLDPEEWPNNVKVTIYRVRKKLQDHDAVAADGGGFRIGPDIDIDIRHVETLVRDESASLTTATRGELQSVLETYRAGWTARYERYSWGHQLTARITDAVCRAGIMLAADAFRRHADDDVVRAAEYVRDIDPLNESAYDLLIRARLRRGDADGARRELTRLSATLARELDAEPSPRLVELLRAAM